MKRKLRSSSCADNDEEQRCNTLLKDSDQSRRCVDEHNASSEQQAYKDKVLSGDDCDQKATVTEKLQVGVLNNMSMNVNAMPYLSRRNDQIGVPHLSKEIMFNIFLLLPADIIHDAIRYVSPVWFGIVHDPYFINEHLLKSSTVLFIQNEKFPEFAHSVEVRETDVKVTKIRYPFRGLVHASCDGLVLYSDLLNGYILHVANPVTKQHVRLPTLQSLNEYLIYSCSCALVYAASTRDYKVVHVYQDGDWLWRCLILTLGVDDTWREIETKEAFGVKEPISVGGFVYWTPRYKDSTILVLDAETEGFHKIPPLKFGRNKRYKSYIAMGSSLSLVVARNWFLLEVWVLSKPKTGEWTRLPDIDIKGQRHIYKRIVPVDRLNNKNFAINAFAWMKHGEVLIFNVGYSKVMYIAHNLKTGQVYSFKLDEYAPDISMNILPHIHSLVLFRSNLVTPQSFPPRCTMCRCALSSPPPPPLS
ncbi:hypothetical protein LguiB_027427 [Lonicera macranthoides]